MDDDNSEDTAQQQARLQRIIDGEHEGDTDSLPDYEDDEEQRMRTAETTLYQESDPPSQETDPLTLAATEALINMSTPFSPAVTQPVARRFLSLPPIPATQAPPSPPVSPPRPQRKKARASVFRNTTPARPTTRSTPTFTDVNVTPRAQRAARRAAVLAELEKLNDDDDNEDIEV